MPELPEVETMRRGLLPLVGHRILEVARVPSPRKPIAIRPTLPTLQKRLVGKTITAVERLGKRVVVVIDHRWRLFFEPRMTGLVLTESPPTWEHVRFRLTLNGRPRRDLLYWDRRGLGSIYCLDEAEYATYLEKLGLGPDACAITEEDFVARLRKTHRPIKVALLDQSLVAGIGNLYASEILHRAHLDPRKAADRVSPSRLKQVYRCMLEVLEEAIRYEGSTLSDGTYRNALNQSGSYQNEHLVYDREGEPCRLCRAGTIKRIVQAQRATFFCPHCQRA